MSDHSFIFPPPPPAPPKSSHSYPGLSHSFAHSNGYRGRGNRGDRGLRGHGDGHNLRSRRGGYVGSSQSTSNYADSSLGENNRHSSPPNYDYGVQTNGHRESRYPLPSYPPVQLPHYPTHLHQGYGQQSPAFQANARPLQATYSANGNGSTQNYNGQQQYSLHDYGPLLPAIQAPLPADRSNSSFQTNAHAGQPILMGPPIRMGFDAHRNGHQTQQYGQPLADGTNAYQHEPLNGNDSFYRQSSPVGCSSGRHEPLSYFPVHRGRGQNRGHRETFNRPRNQNHRIQVAPAVPSFGVPLPLPIKPPVLDGTTRKPRKKKRKHNQLGLTPKAENYDSSEDEEDDVDEEVRLAAVAANTGQGTQL